MLLQGKVAIVTGAGRGIGKGVALKFAAEGAALALVARTRAQLDVVAAEITSAGGRALAVVADVAGQPQTERMAQEIVTAFGRIDVLVNNAGVAGSRMDLVDMPVSNWDTVMDTNLRGAMLCSKAVLPHMTARRSGCIINVSSLQGRNAEWGWAAYGASKWGVIGLTQALARETGKHNIRVNCVVPGLVHNEVVEQYLRNISQRKGLPYEEVLRRFSESHPLRRVVTVGEVADLMVFLASERASAIHGQSISINAGYWMT